MVSSATMSNRLGIPSSPASLLKRSLISSLRILGIQTSRLIPPSPTSHFLWVMLYLLCPTKPGVTAPPPTEPARVVNFIPQGDITVKSRLTVITPLHIGRTAAIHSQHPQVVIGSYNKI